MVTEVDRAINAKNVGTGLEALRRVGEESEARPTVKVDKYDGALAQAQAAPMKMPPAEAPVAPPPPPAPPVLALPEAVEKDMKKDKQTEGAIIKMVPFFIDNGKKFIGQIYVTKDDKLMLYIIDPDTKKAYKVEISPQLLEKEMRAIPQFKDFILVFDKDSMIEMEQVLSARSTNDKFISAVYKKQFIAFTDQHKGDPFGYIGARLPQHSAEIHAGFKQSPKQLNEILKKILGVAGPVLDFTGLHKIQPGENDDEKMKAITESEFSIE